MVLHVVELTLLGGFESLPLRHTVWPAEKLWLFAAKIREKWSYFAIVMNQTGPQRTDSWTRRAVSLRLFSGASKSSPTLENHSGEWLAITNRMFRESDLTSNGCSHFQLPLTPFLGRERWDLVYCTCIGDPGATYRARTIIVRTYGPDPWQETRAL